MNRTSQIYTESVPSDFIKRSYVKNDNQTNLKKQEETQISTTPKPKIDAPSAKPDVLLSKPVAKSKSVKVRRKNIIYLLTVMLLIGMAYGALILNSEPILSKVSEINLQIMQEKMSSSFLHIFLVDVFSGGVFVFAFYLCGFSAISQLIPVLLVFLKGLGYGSLMGYFYLTYGLNGFFYCAVVVLPVGALLMVGLIMSARESLYLSNTILREFFKNMKENSARNHRKQNAISLSVLKLYTIRNAILFMLVIFSSVLDVVLTKTFATIWLF